MTAAKGRATILAYRRNIVTVEVETDRDSVLVLHDIFYPGWQARVDGARRPILRTNLLFRGVEVRPASTWSSSSSVRLSVDNLVAAASELLARDDDAGETAVGKALALTRSRQAQRLGHLPALAQAPAPLTGAAPQGVTQGPPPAPAPAEASLSLRAVLTSEAKPLRGGLTWRIYEDRPEGGKPVVLARSEEAQPTFRLPPGPIWPTSPTASSAPRSGNPEFRDGERPAHRQCRGVAPRRRGRRGEDRPGPARLRGLRADRQQPGGAARPRRRQGRRGVRLPEGTYHVVSTWGDSNAIQRADLKVENGRLPPTRPSTTAPPP